MINKDYILRLAEQLGRTLAIILGLRKADRNEDALIYIDDLLLQMLGFTSRFINSLSEDMLVRTFSPLGTLNVEACLWAASLLKAEGEIYEDMGNSKESYYRYVKSLRLLLEVLLYEHIDNDSDFYVAAKDLLNKLEDYELPRSTKEKLFTYYEHIGQYAKAEDTLFELLEDDSTDSMLVERGQAFYARLLTKSNSDLIAGNFSREEVQDGLAQLGQMQ
ncbi:MAG: hypothetical protein JOZ18_13365 [Chloroflexi bacterium]|nr:hypothetical protein [Chloroflexota bacterium]